MRCRDCKFWDEESVTTIDWGSCTFLSGEEKSAEEIRIEAYPICCHDGAAVDFETRKDFGCIHFEDKK